MIFATQGFTLFHVALSLVGIVAGLVVLRGLIGNKPLSGWTLVRKGDIPHFRGGR